MASAETATVRVQVCYSPGPRQVDCSPLELPMGSTLADALAASGVLQRHGLSLDGLSVGIWGKLRPQDTAVREHDRVEIWRGLKVDPKEARRQRYHKRSKPAAPTSP